MWWGRTEGGAKGPEADGAMSLSSWSQSGVHQVRGALGEGELVWGGQGRGGAPGAGGQQEGPKGRPHSGWKFED